MNSISLQFAEYRGNADELSQKIDRYLKDAEQANLPEDPAALIVPHAGYVYSGPVAAYAYRAVQGKRYDTVVVVGPSHRVPFRGISVMEGDRFETPLGSIMMDTALIADLRRAHADIVSRPDAHGQEHSVEVQIPFLQRSLSSFSLVMAVIGAYSPAAESAFVDTLAAAAGKKRLLVVASSDLSHYHDYASAKKLDKKAVDFILAKDADGLLRAADNGECELCGLLPVHLAMVYAKKRSADKTKLFYAASSGDTAGPKDQVVGYASLAFLPGGETTAAASGAARPKAPAGALSHVQRQRLLEIARRTIIAHVNKGKLPDIKETDPALNVKQGAFVTITRRGQLRGCIGNFISKEALWKTVQSMAVAACSQDPRFTPMTLDETKDMKLEISVLSPMRRITDVNEVEPGKHGLYILKGYSGGTLLPQVATEYGWDRTTFLQQTCRKAGLPADCWKEGAEIYVYEAEVFGED